MSITTTDEFPGKYGRCISGGTPYKAWNGVMYMTLWCQVLYWNSANDI